MKQAILLIITLIIISTTHAQQSNSSKVRYSQYAGRYGSNSGICLFEDGQFMLYGYATAVFGHYNFEKDYLLFYPDKPALFEVFGHYNKSLTDSIRINFSGFEEGKTFVQFNKEKIQRAFNEDANCFDAPFVYEASKKLTNFTLSYIKEDAWWNQGKPNQSWYYQTENRYNDFIWIFNEPKQEYENFSAMLSVSTGKTVLQLSNFGGDEGYIKQVQDKEELKQWQEILELKKQYDESKREGATAIFANKHYRLFPRPDTLNFRWDEVTDQYITRRPDDNEPYYRSNQYTDGRLLRKYSKLKPQSEDTTNLANEDLTSGSIFYTVCGEGTQASYHYNGYEEYEQPETDSIPLVKTIPAPLMDITHKIADYDYTPDSIKNSNDEEPVILLKPFATKRVDGFYAIEKKNREDYTQTILTATPTLTLEDFETVQYKTGDYGESIIQILFNKKGTEKLREFTLGQVGKQIALVVDQKVVVMPLITSPIATGRVDIHWGSSSEEAKALIKQLQAIK